eukprot:9726912-Karenia_brevis.AAC.1
MKTFGKGEHRSMLLTMTTDGAGQQHGHWRLLVPHKGALLDQQLGEHGDQPPEALLDQQLVELGDQPPVKPPEVQIAKLPADPTHAMEFALHEDEKTLKQCAVGFILNDEWVDLILM